MSMTQFALRWILMNPAVTCAIPGAKNPKQADENFSAADLPEIPASAMKKIEEIYNAKIHPVVHHYW